MTGMAERQKEWQNGRMAEMATYVLFMVHANDDDTLIFYITDIKTDLKNNEGLSFIDKITPSDIAFVISVLKNGRNMWDQNIKMKQLGVAVHEDRETKKQPLFTRGKGKKKEQGKNPWSGEGLKYIKRAEKNGKRYMRMMRRCK